MQFSPFGRDRDVWDGRRFAEALRAGVAMHQPAEVFDGRHDELTIPDPRAHGMDVWGSELDRKPMDASGCATVLRPIFRHGVGGDGEAQAPAKVKAKILVEGLRRVKLQAWFADVLTKLAGGHPITRLDELLPWAYARQAKTAVA